MSFLDFVAMSHQPWQFSEAAVRTALAEAQVENPDVSDQPQSTVFTQYTAHLVTHYVVGVCWMFEIANETLLTTIASTIPFPCLRANKHQWTCVDRRLGCRGKRKRFGSALERLVELTKLQVMFSFLLFCQFFNLSSSQEQQAAALQANRESIAATNASS